MTTKFSVQKKPQKSDSFYEDFDRLDGQHPWMDVVPDGFVSYRVREIGPGKVVYFNYFLAKEMGLLPSEHPHQINQELEKKILQTFALQIINEYDELNQKKINPSTIKSHRYMATRYLQLQHSNKRGKTSGDGRGIWNGTISHRGVRWDVSSRGTGVTCLAPGAVEAKKPLKTGGTEFGYGCGQAELDELLGAAILAEAMHLQGIHTERVLCVIDLGKGVGIGVRAAPNLLRPAHLFLYLKQERYKELQAATDYFINRQIENKIWTFSPQMNKYDEMCKKICESFADFTAKLDIDYIFAWLDWDGDNVLAQAGIIDYGSVRQFGIRHDRYRYDDVERFSTNLSEQSQKARLIVQVFLQLADFLKTKKKKPLKEFNNHPTIFKFNQLFVRKRAERLLYRMGFDAYQRSLILDKHPDLFQQFDKEYSYFERAKVSGPEQRVADGVNHPALYNMRVLLRELPKYYLKKGVNFEKLHLDEEKFFNLILSGFAKFRDAKMGQKHRLHIIRFQELYKKLVLISCGRRRPDRILSDLASRAEVLNSDKRITGNALIEIVEEIIQSKKRGLPAIQIQKLIDRLIFDHVRYPEVAISRFYRHHRSLPTVKEDLYFRILSIVHENKETI